MDYLNQRQIENEGALERDLIRSIIDSLEASVYAVDGELRIIHFNEGWKKMLAARAWLSLKGPPESGQCLLDYVPDPVLRAELKTLCGRALVEGCPQRTWALDDGGHHWMIQIVPWRQENHMRGLICQVADDGMFVDLRNQLFHAQRMQMLGRLTGGVVHDFNNLLLAIRGNAGLLLLDEKLDAGICSRLQHMDQAAAKAGDLARRLLALSRGSEEKIAALDFNQVTRETTDLAKRALRGGVSISLDAPDEPLPVQMDAIRAQQLLLNLLVNAAEAMPARGKIAITNRRVSLSAAQAARTCHADGHGFMCCQVADTGAGIPPEVLPCIFKPFFTTKPKSKATGLGLAIVHDVITAADGFIEVESSIGNGTTFAVYLPLDRSAFSRASTPLSFEVRTGI